MIYESLKTTQGNIGVSYISAEKAQEQADAMDRNNCWDCYNCSGCSGCSDCSRCSGCSGCSDCSRCSGCSYCSGCSDCSGCSRCSREQLLVDGEPASTDEQSIENLDKVRAILMDDANRLEMGHWHQDDAWRNRTCAEETLCETTHCAAGWLQVCNTNPAIRDHADPQIAGAMAAPIAAKMFFRPAAEVLAWFESRAYVQELNEIKGEAK